MDFLETIVTIFLSLVIYDMLKILAVGIWFSTNEEQAQPETPEAVFELPESAVIMFMEQDGDVLRAFRHSDSMFICQGKSVEELSENFIKRFPDNVGLIKDFFTEGEDLMIVSEEKLKS